MLCDFVMSPNFELIEYDEDLFQDGRVKSVVGGVDVEHIGPSTGWWIELTTQRTYILGTELAHYLFEPNEGRDGWRTKPTPFSSS